LGYGKPCSLLFWSTILFWSAILFEEQFAVTQFAVTQVEVMNIELMPMLSNWDNLIPILSSLVVLLILGTGFGWRRQRQSQSALVAKTRLVEDAKSNLRNQAQSNQAQSNQAQTLSNDNRKLTEALEIAKQVVAGLETEVETLRAANQDLEAQSQETQTSLDSLATEKTVLETALTAAQQTAQGQDQTVQSLTQTRTQLETQIQSRTDSKPKCKP
jgi:uncharacterized phage infection (PIP) family protein YhgE